MDSLKCPYCGLVVWSRGARDKHILAKHPTEECELKPYDQYNEWCVTHNQVAHLCHHLPDSGIVRNGTLMLFKGRHLC